MGKRPFRQMLEVDDYLMLAAMVGFCKVSKDPRLTFYRR
jgi:hypothetical protein